MKYCVSYCDYMIQSVRTREFHRLKDALEFIEYRALSSHLYNNFNLTVMKE